MCPIVENLLVGIISGLLSSVIITQIYRNVDKKRDRFEYINELTEYAYNFCEHLFYAGTIEIEDEYIMHLSDFVMHNTLPQKKRWVKLTKDENRVCNNFINFCQESQNKIWVCKLNIQRFQRGEEKFEDEVEQAKIIISNSVHLEAQVYWGSLLEIRRKYVD